MPESWVSLATTSICGFTLNDRFECIDKLEFYNGFNRNTIVDIVNGYLELPIYDLLGAEAYVYGVEFFHLSFAAHFPTQVLNKAEIYRDDVLLAITENATSHTDKNVEPNTEYVYTIRMAHAYGQTSDFGNSVLVDKTRSVLVDGDVPQPQLSNGIQVPCADIYGFYVELFRDRNYSEYVRNYGIQKNGTFMTST